MLRESLAGRLIFLTGATGFLGTAIVESVLRLLPETRVAVLIRRGRTTSAEERLRRELLGNSCFDRLRAELGRDAFADMAARRVVLVEGDVGRDGLGLDPAGRSVLGAADIVIHSAATVSFDATLDAAVEINLLGPARVLEAYEQARAEADLAPGHFVAISTAYVAGSRKGDAPEASLRTQPHYPDVDWRAEVEAARALRRETEHRSREPERLETFRRKALAELGAAGVAIVAERTERFRRDWVHERMVELGRARAQSLGWPDAYAMTKALGERVLEERRQRTPVSVVRPSIIESSYAEPRPGWIRGFRMAEPIIISFARGLLRDFPGSAETVVDVIPVDFVVGAVLVAAAHPPRAMAYYHAASGTRNPLRYEVMVSLIRQYFAEHPLYDDKGQAIAIPSWTYPARGEVERRLERTRRAVGAVLGLLGRLPLRGPMLSAQDGLVETQDALERARSYVELYGAYAECEAMYGSERLVELVSLASADDGVLVDPAAIDWRHFILDVHLPSVVEHARARTNPRRGPRRSRDDRLREGLLRGRRLAVFDLENTLVAANVVDSFAFVATSALRPVDRFGLVASLLAEAPKLLRLDGRDRSDFLRYFYRRYRDADPAELAKLAPDLMTGYLLRKTFPEGLARVRQHRAAGHVTVGVTGALRFAMEPFRPLFDELIALDMPERNGRLSGTVPGTLPIGEARADLVRQLAARYEIPLADTIAYADSTSDLPMLEAAGTAVAVNPDAKLRALAKRRGWLIEEWERASGFPSLMLPIGGRR
ncbi:HAD-superfamily subfamily IB hydrolase, TIGR01490 [Acidimicrobium ferrooxidans DSM 10331]|uniref:HAD-superfamily subfamily IB hydrolase, TIGR01490 n=1 Tax=Acidimicrobium ferrooxidans (strain DSM 10331 / JCM 15462 / NBRC 103882 / ICP) TaxID=525909 RepID=C7M048_ACIFD|nr:SDR family oxidoreductase [Acidimicrobium ferrooxidans]ACU54356.1 HAD-superfamily subfamily IB hydrolase, TIGR01490 [Acidimicrobium ferrooxidans DSM 10331]